MRQAEALYKQAQTEALKSGPTSAAVLETTRNLADFYFRQAKNDEALPLYNRCLRLQEAQKGKLDPACDPVLSKLVLLYRQTKQPQLEQECLEKLLSIRQNIYAVSSPEVLETARDLGDLYILSRNAPGLKRMGELLVQARGDNASASASTAAAIVRDLSARIGIGLLASGDDVDADRMLQLAHRLCLASGRTKSTIYADTLHYRSTLMMKNRQYDAAVPLMLESIKVNEQLPNRQWQILLNRQVLAKGLWDQGKLKEAESCYVWISTHNKDVPLATPAFRAAIYCYLAQVQSQQGKHSPAQTSYEAARRELEKLPKPPPSTATLVYCGGAATYLKLGKKPEALRWANQALIVNPSSSWAKSLHRAAGRGK